MPNFEFGTRLINQYECNTLAVPISPFSGKVLHSYPEFAAEAQAVNAHWGFPLLAAMTVTSSNNLVPVSRMSHSLDTNTFEILKTVSHEKFERHYFIDVSDDQVCVRSNSLRESFASQWQLWRAQLTRNGCSTSLGTLAKAIVTSWDVRMITKADGNPKCFRLLAAAAYAAASLQLQSNAIINCLGYLGIARSVLHAMGERGFEGSLFFLSIHEVVVTFAQAMEMHIFSSTLNLVAPINVSTTPLVCASRFVQNHRIRDFIQLLEPLHPSGRNLFYHEFGITVSFFPYQTLPYVMRHVTSGAPPLHRNILLDVGANGFYGSTKALIDMYAPFKKFDDVYTMEPHLMGMAIPESYSQNYSFFATNYSRTGTRRMDIEVDIITLIETYFHSDDFVVLKYDVDEPGLLTGHTMEWGFLADLMHNPVALSLVDELYIELHFHYDAIGWYYDHHDWKQMYEISRYLRSCGIAVHQWP